MDVDDVGRVLTHGGRWNGFVTAFAVAPEHRVAVAVTCTSPDSKRQLPFRFAANLLAAWIGRD